MALDRQTIEKKDFPIGRRGYEPDAVDEHLAQLADLIETLQRSTERRSGASLAQAASEQVRSIVEAAEQSAQAIERDAEEQATRIRTDAERDAERTDQEAVERSREYVAKVGEQSSLMLQRVDAMEAELSALVETLRTGANRLKADLSLLEGNMDELYAASGGQRGAVPEAAAPPAPAPAVEQPVAVGEPVVEPQPGEARPAAVVAPPAAPAGAVAAATATARPAQPAGDEDVEGARLIALNMALNGQPREETDRYLADNFDLGDREGLLDEVYASVGA